MNLPRLNAEFNIGLNSTADSYRHAANGRLAINRGIARRLGDALAGAIAYFRRGAVMAELNGLNDRELADVGLSRSNLKQAFDRDFAREHARRGS